MFVGKIVCHNHSGLGGVAYFGVFHAKTGQNQRPVTHLKPKVIFFSTISVI